MLINDGTVASIKPVIFEFFKMTSTLTVVNALCSPNSSREWVGQREIPLDMLMMLAIIVIGIVKNDMNLDFSEAT